ncbi:hypothetical protein RR46_02968 [Papilio xuthus]|uniref:Uncharacterized protein n=1 Tax=Papilio xuthus TaxID=66420 RepID=A0A194Q9T3_PAPXU|nr:hypothetical protein RR46_02968 [Papilio xuthus]
MGAPCVKESSCPPNAYGLSIGCRLQFMEWYNKFHPFVVKQNIRNNIVQIKV